MAGQLLNINQARVDEEDIRECLESCNEDLLKSFGEMLTDTENEIQRLGQEELMTDSDDSVDVYDDEIEPQHTSTPSVAMEEFVLRTNYAAWLREIMTPGIIGYRCRRARRFLTEKFRSRTDGRNIKIFFTSARHYHWSLKPTDLGQRPFLHGSATGIPELRSYLLGLTAPGRLESLQRHAKQDVTTWFATLNRICECATNQTISPEVEIVREGLRGEMGRIREMVNEIGRGVLLDDPIVPEN
jgi:hypothetical protein